ncbi:MAG: PDZ domain-containing protein, partial [bacterium]|nr:PDZ domain-containing protein [bacterium]
MVKFGYAIPLLGIRSDKSPADNGIVITRIYRGMPAEKAGLQVGDILNEVRLASGISLNPVKSLDEMKNFLKKECKSGDKIELVVYRGTEQIVTSAQLVEKDPQFIVLLPILMREWLGKYIDEDISSDT